MNDYLKELAGVDEPVRQTYYRGNECIDEVMPKYALFTALLNKLRQDYFVELCQLGENPKQALREVETVGRTPAVHTRQGVLMVMMENYLQKSRKFLISGKIAIGLKYTKDSMEIAEKLSTIGYILFHTRKDENQYLHSIQSTISIVSAEELEDDIYKNIRTAELYALVEIFL